MVEPVCRFRSTLRKAPRVRLEVPESVYSESRYLTQLVYIKHFADNNRTPDWEGSKNSFDLA